MNIQSRTLVIYLKKDKSLLELQVKMMRSSQHKKHGVAFFVLLFLAALAVLYLLYSVYVSFALNKVVSKAINGEAYDDSLAYIISEQEYKSMNPRQPESEEGISFITERSNTIPLVLPFLTDAYYTFSYTVTDRITNEVVYGTPQCHVTVKLDYTAFPVHISEVIVAP